ncbi:hypothetical protein [Streptomyces shenzhenensis]|uniref:hypothetical protein n=1 Tax=Streptomyces shenzhenensis TaxID=943815 RepID=UPI0015F064EC|nr:hypothetical protein [Streptomyces shenzhenensis]
MARVTSPERLPSVVDVPQVPHRVTALLRPAAARSRGDTTLAPLGPAGKVP